MNYFELIEENVLLAPLTTFKIGGAARFFVKAKTEAEVFFAVNFAEENSLPIFILGGGSNVLISGQGFDGLVLQIALRGIEIIERNVIAAAGEDWDDFVAFCVEKKIAGLECLSGIPGFVGATPVQNVGAYGQEVSETIRAVRAFDRQTKKIVELSNADCGFAYRTSIFNTTAKNRYIVLAVTYELKPDGAAKIFYQDLVKRFGRETPTLAAVRETVLEIRAEKSMVINKNDPNSRSAGSFFKNPIVTNQVYESISKNAKHNGIASVPKFQVDASNVKIPAAWLIESSGFGKGFEFGKAGLSTRHTLAIINRDHAEAPDIINLKNLIQEKVFEKFGIELMPEPVLVGFA